MSKLMGELSAESKAMMKTKLKTLEQTILTCIQSELNLNLRVQYYLLWDTIIIIEGIKISDTVFVRDKVVFCVVGKSEN